MLKQGQVIDCQIFAPSYGECSNGGLSSKHTRCFAIGIGGTIPESYSKTSVPFVRIVPGNGGRKWIAIPITAAYAATPKVCADMFGGCLIDGYGLEHPVHLHDRHETWEEYETLSR